MFGVLHLEDGGSTLFRSDSIYLPVEWRDVSKDVISINDALITSHFQSNVARTSTLKRKLNGRNKTPEKTIYINARTTILLVQSDSKISQCHPDNHLQVPRSVKSMELVSEDSTEATFRQVALGTNTTGLHVAGSFVRSRQVFS